jgi:glutamyl-tRNA synthetase
METSSLEAALRQLAEDIELKPGQLFGILRIAVTGQRVSPPLIESMEIIGKDEVVDRVSTAIDKLSTL